MSCLPFYRPRGENRIPETERREEGKKEREIRLPGVCRPPLRVGPADLVDRGGSGVAPRSCWPLQHTCGRRALFLSSIPSERTEWSKGPLTEAIRGAGGTVPVNRRWSTDVGWWLGRELAAQCWPVDAMIDMSLPAWPDATTSHIRMRSSNAL